MASLLLLLSVLAPLQGALAQSGAYQQCGGVGWVGSTTCVSGYVCTYSNDYYSQCLPGVAPTTTSHGITVTTTATGTGSASSPPPTGGLGSPSPTLLPNYYWIRAVEAPNFHSYLQSSPPQTTGLAVLASYTTAGQFNVVNGNLVQVLSNGSLLYGIVETPTSSSVKLSVTWSTSSAGAIGTFAWSGDALQWTIPTISRPNNSAWLVCESQHLYINLGPYAYNTPPGCADETIHYYNGATAVD